MHFSSRCAVLVQGSLVLSSVVVYQLFPAFVSAQRMRGAFLGSYSTGELESLRSSRGLTSF